MHKLEGHKMTIFWRKYNELCDERGIKPRTLATELGISAATVTKWVNDGMPNLDMITRIAEYFDVPIDYLINEDDSPAEDVDYSRPADEADSRLHHHCCS